jgi:hypothetical protein
METHDPIKEFFRSAVVRVFNHDFGLNGQEQVKNYVTELLVKFMASEEKIAPRDRFGQPVLQLSEMLEEGDVSVRADSFAREREVHRHIGDHLLFWSGMFPAGHQMIRVGPDRLIAPLEQGRASYEIVSLFDLPPHEVEAPMFRELSENFEAYQFGLGKISRQLWAA